MITNSRAGQEHKEQERTVPTDVTLANHKIIFYNVRILGASASDIVRYNKDNNTKRGQKFTGMITRPMSLKKVQKSLSRLKKHQLIKSIGKLKGETRYTINNREVHTFIGNCLVIQDQIISLMNKLWQYRIRKIDSYDRRWLEMIYGHRRADRIISNNLAFLDDDLPRLIDERLSWQQELLNGKPDPTSTGGDSDDDNRKAAIRAEIEQTQKQVEEEAEILERYIRKQIQDMQAVYATTFKNYQFPVERIMQLVTLPYIDSSKRKNRT